MIARRSVCRFCQLLHHSNMERHLMTPNRPKNILSGKKGCEKSSSSKFGLGDKVMSVEELMMNEKKEYGSKFKSGSWDRSQNNKTYNYNLSGKGKMSKRTFERVKSVETMGEVIYGFFPVYLAIEAGKRHCYELFIQDTEPNPSRLQLLDMAVKRGIKTTYLHKGQLLSLSGARPNQGICMDVSPVTMDLFDPETEIRSIGEDPNRKSLPIFLLAYKVKDPMNFGAILRSSYFLGVEKIIVPNKESCGLTPIVSKASAGALEILPMSSYDHDEDFHYILETWRNNGGVVIGTGSNVTEDDGDTVGTNGSPRNSTVPVESFVVDKPTLLIIGNEEKGIGDSVLSECDKILTISPGRQLVPGFDSLNVSVATGVILHTLYVNSLKT